MVSYFSFRATPSKCDFEKNHTLFIVNIVYYCTILVQGSVVRAVLLEHPAMTMLMIFNVVLALQVQHGRKQPGTGRAWLVSRPREGQTLEGLFSAVSKLIFEMKY